MTIEDFVKRFNSLSIEEIKEIREKQAKNSKAKVFTNCKELALKVRENFTNSWLKDLEECPEKLATGITITHFFRINDFYFETIKEMGFVVRPNIQSDNCLITRIEFV